MNTVAQSLLNSRINNQLEIPKPNHDLNWLRSSLQAAGELELFTIPPYLYALWSIQDPQEYAAKSIRSIVIEEMLHLGYVCNMLKAIGTTPDFTSPDRFVSYPSQLPGFVNRQLEVNLSPFSKDTANIFMEIEKPEDPLEDQQVTAAAIQEEDFDTIGHLYESIHEAFKTLNPELELTGQITGPKAPNAISSMKEISDAIEIIREQGEGSNITPNDENGELAHYYRFGELYHGKKFIEVERGQWRFEGDPVSMPATYDISTVPQRGFDRSGLENETIQLLDHFNRLYSNMIRGLEKAWQTGEYPRFMKALETMFEMEGIARELMSNHQYKPTQKNVGPEFLRSF